MVPYLSLSHKSEANIRVRVIYIFVFRVYIFLFCFSLVTSLFSFVISSPHPLYPPIHPPQDADVGVTSPESLQVLFELATAPALAWHALAQPAAATASATATGITTGTNALVH